MAVIQHDALEVHTFVRPVGQVESMNCNLCGAACTVERNRPGVKKWYVGGTGLHQPHDLFTCPNAEAPWHEQAFRLVQEMTQTESKRVREMLHADLADILAENGVEFRPEIAECVYDGTDMNDDGSSQ